MRIRVGAATDVGRRRKENEDCHIVAPELGLYLVADGMGGHSAGELASRLAGQGAVEAVRALQGATSSISEKLRGAVASANREIFTRATQDPDLAGMGTTLVALLASDQRAALAHVGDSRAYLVRSGGIRQLTDDHSVVGELLRQNQISADAAREHPHRHILTRAVGVRPVVEPDLAELSPNVDDVFVMCSDGLTDHVQDEEIAKLVTDNSDDLDKSTADLIALANQRGGLDNITVVIVRFEAD